MAEKLTLGDIQNLINVNPKLAKEMSKAAQSERDYWISVVAACGGGGKVSVSGSRSSADDGKTHRQAILDGLATFKEGAKASELRAKMEADGHPISPTTFASTMAYLTDQKKEILKKKAKGSTRNVYRVKAGAKPAKPAKAAAAAK